MKTVSHLILLLFVSFSCSQNKPLPEQNNHYKVINDTFDLFEGRDSIPSGLIPPPLVHPFNRPNKEYEKAIKEYLRAYEDKNLIVFMPDTIRVFDDWEHLQEMLKHLNIREDAKLFFGKGKQAPVVTNPTLYTFTPYWLTICTDRQISRLSGPYFTNLGKIDFSEVVFSRDGTWACYSLFVGDGKSVKSSVRIAKYMSGKWVKIQEQVLSVS